MRPKRLMKVFRGLDGVWHWFCRHCWSTAYGTSAHWEVAQHMADVHLRERHRKPIAHDLDETPPNGVHRYGG